VWLLQIEHVSLTFGGVKALTDVSFDVREHEIRAIIGPNGAGKSSLLNVINGVYTPVGGTINYRGQVRERMHPHDAARTGIARTFQSLALFKGMSVLDNIMTGRTLRMRSGLLAVALHIGPAAREEIEHRKVGRADHRLSRDPGIPPPAGRQSAVWTAEARRPSAAHWHWSRSCCCSTSRWRG